LREGKSNVRIFVIAAKTETGDLQILTAQLCWLVQYSTVQYSTVQYSTVQYSTVRCILNLLKYIYK